MKKIEMIMSKLNSKKFGLHYIEAGLSCYEVPFEVSLCIYISGCLNSCPDCHYPELQRVDHGDLLIDNYVKLIELYYKSATCVCFLGEGNNTAKTRNELLVCSAFSHNIGLKTCLYSGREIEIEGWMEDFDYIKVGSYKPEFGSLNMPTTNQKMFYKTDEGYVDITAEFWK